MMMTCSAVEHEIDWIFCIFQLTLQLSALYHPGIISRDLRIVFFVRIESAVRFVFKSNLRIESAGAVTQPNGLLQAYNMLTTSIVNVCDEREWCTAYGTPNWVLVYVNSVIKRVKQCCCALILLPKSTLNANLTTTNRFFTNDDWQRGRFESDHQYESNLESDVRFEIESNHEASQVPNNKQSGGVVNDIGHAILWNTIF